MAGDPDAMRDASAIVALETELAKAQWTKVELRDPIKAYNKVELDKLGALAPGFDWKRYLDSAGVEGKVTYLIVGQPSYITAFAKILDQTPLPVWKAYFRWHLLSAFAPYLSKPYVDANFAFYGTALNGTPEIRPRWKRGVAARRRFDRRGTGQGLCRAIFPAGKQGAHGCAGQQSAGRLPAEHRRPRLDEPDDQGEGARQARQVHAEDRLSGKMARLLDAQDRVDRSGRQRDARQRIRISPQHRQARQADRSRRMAHDAADRQRLLQPGAERDRVSRPRSCSRRSSTRKPTTRSTTARSAR